MNLFQKKNGETKDIIQFPETFEGLWDRFLRMPAAFENRLPEAFRRHPMPALDFSEDETEYQVTLELPGLEEEDFEVQLMGNQLVVSGERKWKEEKKEKEYHRVESQYGSFQRNVTLPEGARLDTDSIEAAYEKGILRITIPKVEPTPAKKIKIKAGN